MVGDRRGLAWTLVLRDLPLSAYFATIGIVQRSDRLAREHNVSSSTGSHDDGPSTQAPPGADDEQPAAVVEADRPAETPGPSHAEATVPTADAAAAAAARVITLARGEVWTTVGQIFGGVAASAGFVYLIGGMVMWLRFRHAGLPADQAVSLMSRQQLLVVGLRLMILPALATGVLAWLATSRTSRSTVRPDPDPDPGAGRLARWRVRVGRMGKWRLAAVIAGALLIVVLALMLPASWASLGWAAAAAIIIGFRVHQLRRPLGRFDPRLAMALVAVVAAGLVSLARQLDQPVQLLSAHVDLDSGTVRSGVFVSATGDDVFIGDTVAHTIVALPRSHVAAVTAGPPEERAPHPSLLSAILGGNDFAITPFGWWCNGESYSWGRLGDLCRTQLQLLDASRFLDGSHPSYAPVKVRCPLRATDGCRGSLRLISRKLYRGGPASIPKHVTIGPVPLHTADVRAGDTIPPGKTGYVCPRVPASTRGLLRNLPAVGDDKPTPTVQFQLVVSSDLAGNDIVRRTNYALTIPPPSEPFRLLQSDCSTLHPR
jgi:hypothetical protein